MDESVLSKVDRPHQIHCGSGLSQARLKQGIVEIIWRGLFSWNAIADEQVVVYCKGKNILDEEYIDREQFKRHSDSLDEKRAMVPWLIW